MGFLGSRGASAARLWGDQPCTGWGGVAMCALLVPPQSPEAPALAPQHGFSSFALTLCQLRGMATSLCIQACCALVLSLAGRGVAGSVCGPSIPTCVGPFPPAEERGQGPPSLRTFQARCSRACMEHKPQEPLSSPWLHVLRMAALAAQARSWLPSAQGPGGRAPATRA